MTYTSIYTRTTGTTLSENASLAPPNYITLSVFVSNTRPNPYPHCLISSRDRHPRVGSVESNTLIEYEITSIQFEHEIVLKTFPNLGT